MNDMTFLDRLHARAQGALASPERTELERELAADPALRALAEDYALVFELTRSDGRAATSRTSFDELEPRLTRRGFGRRVAAAAVLLVVGGGAYFAGRWSRTQREPLYLGAIELAPPLAPAEIPADLPPRWAEYDPRGEQGVRFLSDLDEAGQLARALARPLLVYGSYPGCPLCATLDANVFSARDVVELAERTVPVRVNLAELSEAEQRSFTARGYPFLEMWRDDGRTTHSLAKNPDPDVFLESLHDGLAKSDAVGEQRPWAELRAAAGRFGAARAAELEGRMGEAERGFRALLEAQAVPEPIAQRAAAGLQRLSANARALLLEARAAAESDADAARRLLEHALERFRGTRFERDLAGALERLARDGRFPALAEADRSA